MNPPPEQKAPDLRSLSYAPDTFLANGSLPLLFKESGRLRFESGEAFFWQFTPRPGRGPFSFRFGAAETLYFDLSGNGQLRFRDLPEGRDRVGPGIHTLAVNLRGGRDSARLAIALPVAGEEFYRADLRTGGNIEVPPGALLDLHLTLACPDSVRRSGPGGSPARLALFRQGMGENYFAASDLVLKRSFYLGFRDSTGRPVAGTSHPCTLTVGVPAASPLAAFSPASLSLHHGSVPDPLRLSRLAAAERPPEAAPGQNPSAGGAPSTALRFRALIDEAGLYAVGSESWSEQNKTFSYPAQHRPLYTRFAKGGALLPYRLLVHDSVQRAWLFGGEEQGLPGKEALRGLVDSLHRRTETRLAAFLPPDGKVDSVTIYLTLDERTLRPGEGEARIPTLAFASSRPHPDGEVLEARYFTEVLRAHLNLNPLDSAGASDSLFRPRFAAEARRFRHAALFFEAERLFGKEAAERVLPSGTGPSGGERGGGIFADSAQAAAYRRLVGTLTDSAAVERPLRPEDLGGLLFLLRRMGLVEAVTARFQTRPGADPIRFPVP